MATQREEQIEALVREYRELLEQTLPEGPLDIHRIEETAERDALEARDGGPGAARLRGTAHAAGQ